MSPIDVVFSVDNSRIDNDYLLYYLLSAKGMSQILSLRKGIEGTGRKNLPFQDFAKVEISLPELNEQKEIVNKIKKFDNLINNTLLEKYQIYCQKYEYYRDKLLRFEEVSASE